MEKEPDNKTRQCPFHAGEGAGWFKGLDASAVNPHSLAGRLEAPPQPPPPANGEKSKNGGPHSTHMGQAAAGD